MNVILALLLMPVAAILSGVTISFLWDWFIVTTFAAPQLSIPASIGIAYLVKYLTLDIGVTRDKGVPAYLMLLIGMFMSGLTLLCGFIVHLFM